MSRPTITRAQPYTPHRGSLAGQTFTSERQYRNALARGKGFSSFSAQQRAPRLIKSRGALLTLSARQAEDRSRALDALSRMRRDGRSLSQAAKDAGTTPNTVKKWTGDALNQKGRRYVAKDRDHLARSMRMDAINSVSPVEIIVTDSKTASRIARHHAAVRRYLDTGDASGLEEFRGQTVRSQKVAYQFLTDTAEIDRRARFGALSFESIYVTAA